MNITKVKHPNKNKSFAGTHLDIYTQSLKSLVTTLNDNILSAEHSKSVNQAA